MPQNMEIKALAADFHGQLAIARQLATQEPQVLHQKDTFFIVPAGRLKMRQITLGQDAPSGETQLIHYTREDATAPTLSDYQITTVEDPLAMGQMLDRALGTRCTVTKKRTLVMVGRTRVHFDEVEDLGHFIELEVVLNPSELPGDGYKEARELMEKLGISEHQLVEGAYADLLGSEIRQP